MNWLQERSARRRLKALDAELDAIRERRPSLEGSKVSLRTDLSLLESDASRTESEAARARDAAEAAEAALAEVRTRLAAETAAIEALARERADLLRDLSVRAVLPETDEPAPQGALP